MSSLQSIAEQFDELGVEPSPAILGRCLDLCTTYNIDAVEFVEQWMAFSLSHLNGAEPTLDYLNDLERKELANKKVTKSKLNDRLNVVQREIDTPKLKIYGSDLDRIDDVGDVMDSYLCNTPKASKAKSRIQGIESVAFSPTTYSPISGPTKAQSNKSGTVCYTFGNSTLIKSITWSTSKRQKIHIRQIAHTDKNEFLTITDKYLFDTLQEKTLIDADHLYNLAKEIYLNSRRTSSNENDITDLYSDLSHNNVPGQDPIKCIGRICCDNEGKLDINSAMLIGTDDSKLRTVRLNFNQIPACSLFPGQTVMINGINPRGDTLYVKEILTEREIILPVPPISLNNSINMCIVSGPYTLKDDLTYEPLHDFMAYCKQNQPDVLIMIGPFLDADHLLLVDCVLAESYESFFEKMIIGIMDAVGNDTQVLVISSYRDAHGDLVYPTYPYTAKRTYSNLMFLPDPCTVNINGMTIGITSTDIVTHLAEAEFVLNVGDKLKRVINYMFHQGSFYPLNPPSLDVPLDSALVAKYAQIKTIPNMMIVPSDSRGFIRDINNCLIFNPGRLADHNGGTFGRIVVLPPKDEIALSNYVAGQIIKV